MQKRKFIGLSVIVLIATVFLFSGNQALAVCPGSMSDNLLIRSSNSFLSQTPPQTVSLQIANVWDNNPTTTSAKLIGFEWRYTTSFAGKNVSEIDILVPACANQCEIASNYFRDSCGLNNGNAGFYDNGSIAVCANSSMSLFDPGVGTSYLGMNDLHFRTLRIPSSANAPQNAIYFYTKPTGKTATSFLVKSGNNIYVSKDIAGPSCARDITLPDDRVVKYVASGLYYKYTKNPDSECSGNLEVCKDANYEFCGSPPCCRDVFPSSVTLTFEPPACCETNSCDSDTAAFCPYTNRAGAIQYCGDTAGNSICNSCSFAHPGSTCTTITKTVTKSDGSTATVSYPVCTP